MYFLNKKKKRQKGYALILAIFVAAFFMTLTALTSQYTLENLKSTRSDFQKLSQAKNVAEAGLQEAAFWFEKQPSIITHVDTGGCLTGGESNTSSWCDGDTISNSCASGTWINSLPTGAGTGIPCNKNVHMAFKPIVATSTIERGETDDAKGIVRDIIVDKKNNLYGHFEVLRYNPTLWTSTSDGNSNTATMDVSDEKDVTVSGNTNTKTGEARYWRIISTGTLYTRKSDSHSIGKNSIGVYNVTYENKDVSNGNPVIESDRCCEIIGRYTLSENLLKMKYNDIGAAIALRTPGQFTAYSNAIIVANSTLADNTIHTSSPGAFGTTALSLANAYNNGVNGPGTLNPGINQEVGFTFDTYSTFGISEQEMKGVANQKCTILSQLKRDPSTGRLGGAEIIYLEGTGASTFTFTSTDQLKGGGILYVKNANLTLANSANTLYNGVIYVKNGNLTIGSLNSISGTIYVESGNLSINGGTDKADIGYNKKVISNLINMTSKYKEDSLSYKAISVK